MMTLEFCQKVVKKSKCQTCREKLNGYNKINLLHNEYFKRLSRGGLILPSSSLADFTCVCFAILDFAETKFEKKPTNITAKEAATFVLHWCSLKRNFKCEEYLDWENKFAIKVIVNMIFNNKQKGEMTL